MVNIKYGMKMVNLTNKQKLDLIVRLTKEIIHDQKYDNEDIQTFLDGIYHSVSGKKHESQKIKINLNGPEGNAFVLMAYAKDFIKKYKMENDIEIFREMKSGDYNNLISVFNKYFSNFATLEN